MPLFPGQKAPDFRAETTAGPIVFHAWLGASWGLLISHPDDFRPSTLRAATEMAPGGGAFRTPRLLGLSRGHGQDTEGTGVMPPRVDAIIPLVLAPSDHVRALYAGVDPEIYRAGAHLNARSVFVIAPDRTIRMTISYPSSGLQDFGDILRIWQALSDAERAEDHDVRSAA
ncbi:peroxiredoxin [Gluconacetobacter azotocaptans]|uniref:Peroxiredoxin n=1 Tax=Gluconacetobacter azotocaptans TaxID=142834 RepID=A0A7W4PC38_9PROT|nr:peroxiredoxin [Gluconacetobacter azotocaptans]MBB2188787.1 peroxiredoxin [Gluconacetobacter azotocaptans]MBM9402587.1 peroxiredoxin [Gluconacetobacter azotocaptans]GBQ31040.1 peroxiredoxin [Gluconacetobacter azotocaptans DSM 13594]